MKKVRTAVIGVGYLGRLHAEKYASLPESDLVMVCDPNQSRAEEIATLYHTQSCVDYRNLLGLVDAVSIATPTPLHHEIGLFFLKNGVHVLMEKPITTSIEEADELINMAQKNALVLQVGHLERFNNAIRALDSIITKPLFIESLRQAPFKLRGTDVNVILDLMIQDIDIIQSIVKSEIIEIRANAAPILSPSVDIANTRLEFASGCVANVTASRVSLKPARKLSIFQQDCYVSLDLESKNLSIHRKGEQEMFPGIPEIITENLAFDKGDALRDQIASFLNAIQKNSKPLISGKDGKEALSTAIKITNIVRQQINQYLGTHV